MTIDGLTYEEATLARISDARTHQKQEEDACTQAGQKADNWKEYGDALQNAFDLGKRHSSISLSGQDPADAERRRTQSTWSNLRDLMVANKGILVVLEAVTTLVAAGVYNDREHARNSIYSTLNSRKKDVERVRQGVYRLADAPDVAPHKAPGSPRRSPLGNPISFKDAVLKVLRAHGGQPLHCRDMWTLMQALGVVSKAQDPVGWVDRAAREYAKKAHPKIEKVGPRTWRWKGAGRE